MGKSKNFRDRIIKSHYLTSKKLKQIKSKQISSISVLNLQIKNLNNLVKVKRNSCSQEAIMQSDKKNIERKTNCFLEGKQNFNFEILEEFDLEETILSVQSQNTLDSENNINFLNLTITEEDMELFEILSRRIHSNKISSARENNLNDEMIVIDDDLLKMFLLERLD